MTRSWRSPSLLFFITKRFLLAVLLLLGASFLIFVGTAILPGDFAANYLGQTATPDAVAALREKFGLDRPILGRYFAWLAGVLHGDFGSSWANGISVSEQIAARLANSLWLALFATAISVPMAIGLGVLSVRFQDRVPDRATNIVSLLVISFPDFFIAYVLVLIFAVNMHVVPFPSTIYDGMTYYEWIRALILPTVTLVLVIMAHMMRMTRAAILAVMSSSYIETAELKGLSSLRVIIKHAAPNAVSPIVSVVALSLAYLIVSAVVVEVVFVYPGMGQYMVDAVSVRDMPVVQACALVFAAVYIVLNMAADVLAMIANPKLRYPR